MTTPDSKLPRSPTSIEWVVILSIAFILMILIVPSIVPPGMIEWPLYIIFVLPLKLLYGALAFATRTPSEIHLLVEVLLTFCIVLTAGIAILYRLSRGSPKPVTPIRWNNCHTISAILLSAFCSIAGIALISTVPRITWLAGQPKIFCETYCRTVSRNKLKSHMLATHEYHEKWETFPAGGTLLGHNIPGHSWQTALLPYLDRQDLYQTINFERPWMAEENKTPFSTTIPVYRCLETAAEYDRDGYALTHYAGNSHLLNLEEPLKINQITDGTSNTLLSGEAHINHKPWGNPTNSRDPILGLKTSPDSFGNPVRDDYTMFGLADGSVRTLNNNIDPKVLKALATPDGGENIVGAEW